MSGTRLGVMCEGFALTIFGLIIGMFISWQLTIVVFIGLTIIAVAVYIEVFVTLSTARKTSLICGQRSSVKFDFCR